MSGRTISCAEGTSVDQRIAMIAAGQRGRASSAQMLSFGIDRFAIGRRVRNGRLIPRHPGVYVVGHAAMTELGDETAALLACGLTAMLSHHSAATVWGLRPGVARPIHVLVPEQDFGTRGLEGAVIHRSRILQPRDIQTNNDLPVTSPARTMLDIAATLPEKDLGYILEQGLRTKLLKESDVYELLRRAGGHPGGQMLTSLMTHRTGNLTESVAQRRLLEVIQKAQLPHPETEVPLLDYRADLFWRDLNLVVEVDGHDYHSTRAAIERGHRRDARLRTAGYTVIRFTASQIEYEPLAVIAQLAQMIQALQARP